MDETRRRWIGGVAGGALALTAAGCGLAKGGSDDEDVAPPEDLMREHGALNRILLIYDDVALRLDSAKTFPVDALEKSADIVRRFIEGYHEKLEEDFLFPRFEAKGKLVDLVATLRTQHQKGRTVTEAVLRLAKPATLDADAARRELAASLRAFTRMYRPHEAREDTVLFPALRSVVGKKEFAELGEKFEAKEHELFGKAGFEGIVAEIARLEQAFGLDDLNQFNPT